MAPSITFAVSDDGDRLVTRSLRIFDEEMAVCSVVTEYDPKFRRRPHQLKDITTLPWGFDGYTEVFVDRDPDTSGDWLQACWPDRRNPRPGATYIDDEEVLWGSTRRSEET